MCPVGGQREIEEEKGQGRVLGEGEFTRGQEGPDRTQDRAGELICVARAGVLAP